MRAITYRRVSTREQGDSGLGLAAQRTRLLAELQSRNWNLALDFEEVASLSKRRTPMFERMLRTLDLGQADVLVITRLDRVSRSFGEFGMLVDRAQKGGWSIVILEPAIDLSTPAGRMLAGILASVAQWEREITSQRTKEGLAELRRRGVTKNGTKYRPLQPYGDQKTIRRIVRLRTEKSMSMEKIAEFLTEAGVPSPHEAGKWNHKTVSKILEREGLS